MSIKIDHLCRFSFADVIFFLRQVRQESMTDNGTDVWEYTFPPFDVNPYGYPYLYGVEFTIRHDFRDELSGITFEWISPDGTPHKEWIALLWEPSNLGKGGNVGYFVCPHTGHKCRKLYTDGRGLYSRYAFKHHYSYQNDAASLRPFAAIGKSENRIRKLEGCRRYYGGKLTRKGRQLEKNYAKHHKAAKKIEEKLLSRFRKKD